VTEDLMGRHFQESRKGDSGREQPKTGENGVDSYSMRQINVRSCADITSSGYTSVFSDASRPRLKCDGTRAETRFRLSAKRTNPFKLAGASVQSTTGGQGVRIRGSNTGYTMFRGSAKSTGYPLHSPVSPSLPLPCITVCHHVSTGLNQPTRARGGAVG
jgi:hypothetical protein